MAFRIIALAVLLVFVLSLSQCAADPSLSTITITPANASLAAVGDTVQFKAIATYTRGKHPQTSRDVTTEVTWESSTPSAATIDANGLATDVGVGTTTITATLKGDNDTKTDSATLTATGHDLQALTIVPTDQTLYALGETAQFIAVGTFNSPPLAQDMTDQVTWHIVDVDLATINSAGLVTAVNCPIVPPATTSRCDTTISATATSTSGTTIASTNSGTVTVTNDPGSSNLPSLTVYEVGQGSGTVTSSPVGINCPQTSPTGPTGGACTANFVLNAAVTLTATPAAGSQFGGWSANCTPSNSPTCTLTMVNSDSVGVIFNPLP